MKAVSKTACYCCGVRMQDAESAHPLIGDKFAKKLLGEEA
jgi:O-methyltransferase involved in polyketide biosynthesis